MGGFENKKGEFKKCVVRKNEKKNPKQMGLKLVNDLYKSLRCSWNKSLVKSKVTFTNRWR